MRSKVALSSSFALIFYAIVKVSAQDASYRTLNTASNPDWMMRVPDGTSLPSISIPGTHDTLSIHGGTLTECQENYGDSADTITAQLNAGIRMLDIRLRVNDGNTLTVHHGSTYQNANFDDVLNKIGGFLDAHPAEAVLMRVKHECTGSIGSCNDASGQASFEDIFDSYRNNNRYGKARFWADSVNRNSAAANPTMATIRGKMVVLILQGTSGERLYQYGLSQLDGWHDGSSTYVQDDYNVANTGAIATKRDQVRRFLDRTNAEDQTKIYVNFASGSSLFAMPYQVAGGGGGTQGVNPFLLIYLGQGTDVHAEVHRTGIILMDFPGGTLINKILSFN